MFGVLMLFLHFFV